MPSRIVTFTHLGEAAVVGHEVILEHWGPLIPIVNLAQDVKIFGAEGQLLCSGKIARRDDEVVIWRIISVTLHEVTIIGYLEGLGFGILFNSGVQFVKISRSKFMPSNRKSQHRLDMRKGMVERHT